MSHILVTDETLIRLAAFAGVLAVMAAWEILAPRRRQKLGRGVRWPGNFGVVVLDAVLVRLVFPTTALGLALLAETRGWGLFYALGLPAWLNVLLAVAALDLVIYLQHVLFHAVPVLWRLHRMHHADLEIDVTTGARFHPIEILLSMGLKLGVVAALGAPGVAVLASGHIPMMPPNVGGPLIDFHRAGKVRILAVNAATRIKAAPDIPTAIEAGLPGMIAGNLNGLFAPAGVAKPTVDRIAEVTRTVMADADVQSILLASGFEPILDSGPDATRQFISEELARWTPIMKATGFKME